MVGLSRSVSGQGWTARRISGAGLLALALLLAAVPSADARRFSSATYSSPITLSADGRYVWSVNPANDTVSVIRTRSNTVIKTIQVGDEPRSQERVVVRQRAHEPEQ